MHDPRESFRPSPPVILDFDGSVLPVAEGERRIPLGSWQEAIRFGCTRRAFSALEPIFSIAKNIISGKNTIAM